MLKVRVAFKEEYFTISAEDGKWKKFPSTLDGDALTEFRRFVLGGDLLGKVQESFKEKAQEVIESLQNFIQSGAGADKRIQAAETLKLYVESVVLLESLKRSDNESFK